ncbi:MAG: zinc-dependent alcohol dehydrogenase [Acidobacteriaceae bacterium]
MRALVYTEPGKVELQEKPRVAVKPGEVEIAIDLAGVCGSDISGFLGHSARRKPPLVLGHELVGRLENGRRVVANPLISCRHCVACLSGNQNLCESWRLLGMDSTPGTFAEFVSVPTEQIYEIPESLPASRAILTEPLANIVHLYRLLNPEPFFTLAIVGAGTMGALALVTGLRIGAKDVLVADVNDVRLHTAGTLGAATTINTGAEGATETKSRTAGRGFDIVIDASGHSAARQLAFSLCRPGGQVALLGMAHQKSEIDFVTSIRKEHRVVMSFAYTPNDFQRSLAMLIKGEVDLTPWLTQMPLEEGQKAMELVSYSPGATLKAALQITRTP